MLRRSARALSLWFILPAALASSALANPPDNPGSDDDGAEWEEGEAADDTTCPLVDHAGPASDEEPEVEFVKVKPTAATNLSALEKAILEETNLLRKNPPAYAEKLVALRPSYQGKLIHRPGQPSILTQEGVAALDEAIDALRRAPKRLSRLAHADGLSRAARDHARDLGRTGSLGHTGSDGSGPDVRARRHGTWDGLVAENIAFGPTDAEEIVIGLLVDDGVKDRGHREVLLTRDLYFAGVACGPHPGYGTTCVMTYATSFKTRGEAAAEAPSEDRAPRAPMVDFEDEPSADHADADEPAVRPVPDPWRSPKADDTTDLGVYADDDVDDAGAGPDTDGDPRVDLRPDDRDDADDPYAYEPPQAPRATAPAPGPGYYPGPSPYPGPRYYGPRYYGPRPHYGPRYYPGPRYYYGPRYRPYR